MRSSCSLNYLMMCHVGLRNSAIYTQSENNQRTDDRHRCQRQ
ncbi:Uncharacterised protein [Klebsiella pneumoniae]|nr:Uncharacterised protein [Klebsiella pneumoniae]SVW26424.1 Uncharacterised protein [Klebsiella pneumoniae]